MLGGNSLQRRKLVDAGIVHKNIELSERFLRFSKKAANVIELGYIGLNCERFPVGPSYAFDDCLRAGLTATAEKSHQRHKILRFAARVETGGFWRISRLSRSGEL